jgi:hypothetical protein
MTKFFSLEEEQATTKAKTTATIKAKAPATAKAKCGGSSPSTALRVRMTRVSGFVSLEKACLI